MSNYLKEGFIDPAKRALQSLGDKNVIESIKVNGVDQDVDNKAVNIKIPTKNSELENDSGYLTQYQDLTGYAKTEDVTKQVTEEISKIVAGAPEDFDTLKEMSDWISKHEDSAAAINSSIQTNKSNIESLESNKVDKVTGKGLSTNDYTDADKGKLSELESNIESLESNKVDKVTGKGLSTNDYTDADKTKLDTAYQNAEQNVQSDWNETDSTSDAFIKNKPEIPGSVDTSVFALKEKYGDTTINIGRKKDTTVGAYSIAEGYNTTASGEQSHAEGFETTASGNCSHSEGRYTTASNEYCSHAEGSYTTASGYCSHSEGTDTTASGEQSHVEGYFTTASANYSHAEGFGTTASGNCSHAEGSETTSSGEQSHAEGNSTTALDNQHAQGHYNNTNTATGNVSTGTTTGTAFVIGNGTRVSSSNAFRITGEGMIYATNATVQTGADYAEYFEWSDDNPKNEDRVGHFVTFDENDPEKIRYANNDDYILGIVSGMPNVIGNGDEDWKKRYILDDFGRYIVEEFEYEEVVDIDEETEEKITETKIGTKWKENPDYDNSKPYVQRKERPEWDAIGMLGVLSVYDDGTCKVNGYCRCGKNGIATSSNSGYRVIARITNDVVKVVFR